MLRDAGYQHHGRVYMLVGPEDRRALVEFQPDVTAHRTALRVGYGIWTPAYREFRESRGIRSEAWPLVMQSFLHSALLSPAWARVGAPGRIPVDRWVLGDEQRTADVGAAIASGLERDVLPRLESWFDPGILADTIEHRDASTMPGLSPRPRAVALALLEADGADVRLRQILNRLPPDDMVREWVEGQLASRQA